MSVFQNIIFLSLHIYFHYLTQICLKIILIYIFLIF